MPSDPRFAAPDPREVDPRAVRRAFARAVATYDGAAILQREVGTRMAQRLDYVRLAPARVLDAGCGTGEAIGELGARYPDARIVGLDLALPMVAAAHARASVGRSTLRRLKRCRACVRCFIARMSARSFGPLLPQASIAFVWSAGHRLKTT